MAAVTEFVNKVTLSSGKVVLLREFKIKHQELAIKAVGNRAGDNTALMALMSQAEIIKMLVLRVDAHDIKPGEMEDLDKWFSPGDYRQLLKCVEKLMGDDGDPKLEVVSSGSNTPG